MVKYPDTITTPRSKAAYVFFKGLYIFETGKGKIFGRFTGWMTEVGVLMITLKYFNIYEPKGVHMIILSASAISACFILGYIYMRYNIDKIESLVGQERQPMLKDLYSKLIKKGDNL